MSNTLLDKISRIHFIGVGGIGVSALARHLYHEKKLVSGSDRVLSPITKALDSEGLKIYAEQVSDNITKDIELVVYTEAVTPESEGWAELEKARELGIPTVNYFEALGMAMNPYYLIAVAGTHGKTTTTAMITDIFEVLGKDPTAIIGSLRAKTKSNYRPGKSKYAIVEACEYKRDFLHLRPDILVITNIEFEHVDYYKDLADVQSAFRALVEQVNEDGVVIANTNDPALVPVINDVSVKVVDYTQQLDLEMTLRQPGMHNRLNASAALTVALQEKLPLLEAKEALAHFAGTWRRFEYKGDCNGAPVYDDYGHHPTEIKATVAGVRELYPDRRLVVAFQPHTYTRTKTLFNDFAKVLGSADQVVLLPIYSAREVNVSKVSSRELSVKTLEYCKDVQYFDEFSGAEDYLRQTIGSNDVVVVMGAGTVTDLAGSLVK
jgi:UDP-N-acetylmuramate--alanine ligase